MKFSLGVKILFGLVLGLLLGLLWPAAAQVLSPLGEVFLRMLKMLMVPLVFFSIAAGVCKMGDVKHLRTVGLWFVIYVLATSGLCALLGVGTGLLCDLGSGTKEFLDAAVASPAVRFSFVENAISWFPENVFESMVRANMVQVIVFAIFFGVALLSLGERVACLVEMVDKCSDVMLKITEFVMWFAPIGIGSLVAKLVISVGGDTAKEVVGFIAADNLCCIMILVVLYPLLIAFMTRHNPLGFFRRILDPMVVAVTTTSSAATLPVSIRTAKNQLGIPERVYGFVLPLGNTCGMNGFAATIGLLSVFASHVYGRPITIASITEFTFLGIVLSVGAAGVKGAGIIMSGVLLETMGMPLDIVPIIAAIWPLVDPMMTVTNNVSDLAGTTIIADRMGQIDEKIWKGNCQ